MEGSAFLRRSRKEQIFLFVEIQLSDAPSVYVTGAGTAPWAVHAEVEGIEVVVTSRRMPAQEVPDPN